MNFQWGDGEIPLYKVVLMEFPNNRAGEGACTGGWLTNGAHVNDSVLCTFGQKYTNSIPDMSSYVLSCVCVYTTYAARKHTFTNREAATRIVSTLQQK